MPIDQSVVRRQRLRLAGGSAEPVVPVERLLSAIGPDDVERFRPLLPVGYEAGAAAYRLAAGELTAADLANHYTDGLAFFHDRFVPHLKGTLHKLSGGVWDLSDFVAYAAGSDVDFMTHLVEAIAARDRVCLFPGDWFGFQVGATQTANIAWDASGRGELACLCVPSVRNGHLTEEMLGFLDGAPQCLLNLNLYPTLTPEERREVAEDLKPALDRAVLSISFSRGFGLTASQLGVFLVHRDHPYRARFDAQWQWFTYFFNALAARAFMLLDAAAIEAIDRKRRIWVHERILQAELPLVETGSYYVKSFRPIGEVPARLTPLMRGDVLRMCFKPSARLTMDSFGFMEPIQGSVNRKSRSNLLSACKAGSISPGRSSGEKRRAEGLGRQVGSW